MEWIIRQAKTYSHRRWAQLTPNPRSSRGATACSRPRNALVYHAPRGSAPAAAPVSARTLGFTTHLPSMPALELSNAKAPEDLLSRLRRSGDRWWPAKTNSAVGVSRGGRRRQLAPVAFSVALSRQTSWSPCDSRSLKTTRDRVDEGPDGIHRTYREWHAAEQSALSSSAAGDIIADANSE